MNWFKRFWKALSTPAQVAAQTPGTDPAPPWPQMEPIPNFTPRAQQVLALSRKEADRFNHNFVGTEHLLLGIIALGQGVAVNVLQRLGLRLETVRLEVEKQVGTGPAQKLIGHIPYTPRVKKVLGLAAKEAKALNHTYVGTEHVLLGLLREGDGVAARVLQNLEIDVVQVRREILKELDPNFDLEARATASSQPAEIEVGPPPQIKALPRQSVPVEFVNRELPYDVYCSERNQAVIVYRGARFKGVKRMFEEHPDPLADFYELELADGNIVFVNKISVTKFCAPGTNPAGENVPNQNP